MIYNILSNLVILVHLLFILFVCLGALLALRWPKVIWIHIPCAIWGMVVEYLNIVCPLTPLENQFRKLGDTATYNSDFITRYVTSLIYPEALSRNLQYALGTIVLTLNIIFYSIILYKRYKMRTK